MRALLAQDRSTASRSARTSNDAQGSVLRRPKIKSAAVVFPLSQVPWKSLGKEPVIVLIDRVFVLAYPPPDDRTLKEEDREKLLETKLQQIEEAESATLDARAKSKLGSDLEVVAEGRVCSTDPDERVHFVPLGPNASKVWIDVSKIGDADVWRPNSEVVCVDDAKGTTIAWPNDKLNSN